VQKLALQLFDAIGWRIGCTTDDRQTLADAALLHDVGYHINYDGHHKHSLHLIRHAELLGVSPVEQMVIAHVARYHRGNEPDRRRHRDFAMLDRDTRRRITRLAALLRVADGFDRGHIGAIAQLKVRWMARAVRITPAPHPKAKSIRLELWGATRKSGLLARIAQRPVEVVGPDRKVVAPTEVPESGL
jgi:exopolyphosphatase/guanosine-5'-triphosphate,3'-diphosphate pyrophosphatase